MTVHDPDLLLQLTGFKDQLVTAKKCFYDNPQKAFFNSNRQVLQQISALQSTQLLARQLSGHP